MKWTVEGEARTVERFQRGGAGRGEGPGEGEGLERGGAWRGEGSEDVAQWAEDLPSTFEAVDSNP